MEWGSQYSGMPDRCGHGWIAEGRVECRERKHRMSLDRHCPRSEYERGYTAGHFAAAHDIEANAAAACKELRAKLDQEQMEEASAAMRKFEHRFEQERKELEAQFEDRVKAAVCERVAALSAAVHSTAPMLLSSTADDDDDEFPAKHPSLPATPAKKQSQREAQPQFLSLVAIGKHQRSPVGASPSWRKPR